MRSSDMRLDPAVLLLMSRRPLQQHSSGGRRFHCRRILRRIAARRTTSLSLFLLACAASVGLAPCASRGQSLPVAERLSQRTGVPLGAHIGGQVFKIARTSPLPNAFGRADIFGRTVDRGSMELRYQGQTMEGKLVFRLVDIDTRSNETTMNRT